MTFQQLQYLLMAQQSNSISKAAERLFVAPSSVSACINSLEKELGFPIFVRNQKGLIPTPKGETILKHAQRMVKIYNQMGNLREETPLHLRVCANDYYLFYKVFAELVAQSREFEDVNFFIHADSAESAIRRISVGELDVVVIAKHSSGWWKLQTLLEENRLQWQILKKLPYSICVGPGHRLYDRTSVQPQELHREVFVDTAGRAYGTGFWGDLVEINSTQRISVGNDVALWELLRQGIGYCIRVYAPEEAQANGLRHIPVEGLTATLCAVTNPNASPNLLTDRYIELLEQELEKL